MAAAVWGAKAVVDSHNESLQIVAGRKPLAKQKGPRETKKRR